MRHERHDTEGDGIFCLYVCRDHEWYEFVEKFRVGILLAVEFRITIKKRAQIKVAPSFCMIMNRSLI